MEVFAHETGRLPEGNLRFPAGPAKGLKHVSGCNTVVTRSAAAFVERAFSGIFVR